MLKKIALCIGMLGVSCLHAQLNGVFADKIVIGHIGPLKNTVLADSNKEALDAADMYFNGINLRGGINGRRIALERYDDSQDVAKSIEIAKALIATRTVVALTMLRSSATTEALIPLAEDAGLPLVAPQAAPNSVTEPMKRHVFAVRASYVAEVTRAIELQHTLGRRSFAFVASKDTFGIDTLKGAIEKLAVLGLKPAGVERVDNLKPDVTQSVRTFATVKPEVVMFLCSAKCGADFVKGYAASINSVQYVALSNASYSGFLKDLGERKRGVIVMQVLPSPVSSNLEIALEYRDAAKAAGKPVSYHAFLGYITAKLLAEAIRRTGATPTPAKLTTTLEAMRNVDLGGYVISYGPKERMGSKFVEPTMITKDGRFL